MDEATRRALELVVAFNEYLLNDGDSHDRQLLLEGTLEALERLLTSGHVGDLEALVRRYTRLDQAEAAIAATQIRQLAEDNE